MLSAVRRVMNQASLVSAPVLRTQAVRLMSDAAPAAGEAAREVGTVKWFSKEKGFGFITRADGTDVFVHFSNVRGSGFRTLEEGQSVDFSVAAGKKGQEARVSGTDHTHSLQGGKGRKREAHQKEDAHRAATTTER